MSDLIKNIKAEMQLKNWNAYDLEKTSGVPQSTIHRILSGKHSDPRSSTVKKLATGLGVSESSLRFKVIESESITLNREERLRQHIDCYFLLRTIQWHEIGSFLSSNNHLKRTVNMLINQKVSDKAYGIEIINRDFEPLASQGQIAVIEPDISHIGRTCLVKLNDTYHFMKHSQFEREYLQPIDKQSPRFAINDGIDCKIVGVVEYVLTPARKID